MSDSLMKLEDFTPFADGLDHPEGVTWAPDGYVYAGGEAGQIYRVSLEDGSFEEIGNTGGFILGLAPDVDNNLYACDLNLGAVMKITQAGEVSQYSDNAEPIPAPNYPVFDKDGNLYFSSSGEFLGNTGSIYRISANGPTELVSEDFRAFPNGLALSPDGKYLYVVLSNKPGIERAEILPDGRLGPPEDVVTLERTVPDGIMFDVEGNLYIACYTPNVIYRLAPGGQLDTLAEDWMSTTLSAPTNIVFAGENLKTLVVASLARWHLSKAVMPIAGVPLNCPKLD